MHADTEIDGYMPYMFLLIMLYGLANYCIEALILETIITTLIDAQGLPCIINECTPPAC